MCTHCLVRLLQTAACVLGLLALMVGCGMPRSGPTVPSRTPTRTVSPVLPPSADEVMPSVSPYEAVRNVYDAIARGRVPETCLRFGPQARRAFVTHLGYPDCPAAVRGLHALVTDADAYESSLPSFPGKPVSGGRVTVRSCRFGVQGGPALGVFTVGEVQLDQWVIIGHRSGPRTCPQSTTSTRH